MKRIVVVMMLIFGSLSFSNEALDKMLGTWIDDYNVGYEIIKKDQQYFYKEFTYDEDTKLFEGKIKKIIESKLMKATVVDNKLNIGYYTIFINPKNGHLTFIDNKTKKILYDDNYDENYGMVKLKK